MRGRNRDKENSERRLPFIREDLFLLPSSASEMPHLLGSKCSRCNRVFFPKRTVCSDCLEKNTMVEVKLSRRGKLHSGTIAHVAPTGFSPPYVVGYVDLPEGVRVFTEIKDAQICRGFLKSGTEMLVSGIDMELVIEKIREDDEGNDVIGYKFRPVKEVTEGK